MHRALLLFSLALPIYAAVDFAKEIAPTLETRCHVCHGAKQQMAGLRLDQAAGAAKVTTNGKLTERIKSTKPGHRMPPVGAPLTAKEIAAFEAWITEGAKWPANYTPGGAVQHWSFRPITRPATPQVKKTSWTRNPIDNFVLANLESKNIAPSPEASKLVLLRRVSFDLTGLPPTPAEVKEFLADTRPDAYERLVDRLLQSRHYGERWARPWLDLAHYADSDGYEKDQVRPYAWRYRNYVIDSLNSGKPFDQFTIEQLAGDLLPNPTTEQLVATGFLRNTLTNREAGVDRAEARYEQLVNRVNTVGTTWLGLAVGCAQCHDHKYDPISNKDFYRLFAFFDATDDREIEAPMPGEREQYLAAMPWYLGNRGHILEKYGIPALQTAWEAKLIKAMDHPGEDVEWDFWVTSMRAMVDHAERVMRTPPAQRTPYDARRITDYFISNGGPDNTRIPETLHRIKAAREEINELKEKLPAFTMAMAVAPHPDHKQSVMRIKGDYKALSDPINPGGLSAMHPMSGGASPTRLDLAKWLVSKDNPLTPRVTVNRAWQEFFGRGLVRTSEDFGTQGERPTHPELLDWLATQFISDGWSMKKLHRLIVTSSTYRQSSDTRQDLAQTDPDNALLARQIRLRLPAELVRDAALSSSGLLDNRIGGPSIRPYQPPGVAELGYGGSIKWKMSEGPDRFRRGLYVHFQRTTPYPQLMNFDAPDSNVSCSRRRPSNTPLQSLNLLNDPVFHEAAQSLAARVLRERKGAFADRLELAFALTLGRTPDTMEKQRLSTYYDQQLGILSTEPAAVSKLAPPIESLDPKEAAAWVGVSRVIMNLDEFITRE
ncbi:MAG: PSD1 domain-containing protein [Acidobacteria bacterium]|nr:PSD1 domain-containing protein [Acidobacteriota bacterium]